MSSAQELKAAGNDLFRAGQFALAAEKYSAALEALGDDDKVTRVALFSNRKWCRSHVLASLLVLTPFSFAQALSAISR